MLIFTPKAWLAFQCLTALSLVPTAPCLYGLMGWLVDIAVPTAECVEVSCWLVGFWAVFGFYLWDMCSTELFRDGVQRAAGSLGGAWSRCAWPLGAASFLEAVALADPFLERAAHRRECCSLLLLRQVGACLGTLSWLLNTGTQKYLPQGIPNFHSLWVLVFQ